MLVPAREHAGMEDSTKRKLAQITGQMEWSEDFVCYKFGFKTLCQAEDLGRQSWLKCLEKNPGDCRFSLGYAE